MTEKNMTICECSRLLKSKKASSVELTDDCIRRIKDGDGRTQAFLSLFEDSAKVCARFADENRTDSSPLLFGIPYAAKDNLAVKGMKTTAASKMLENYISPYSATVIQMLSRTFCPLVGKTNMDEFGMGSYSERSAFFPVKNPHNALYVAGGSSGGSAASVAAGFVPFALGSDTGGSVRLPAAFCGAVGLRPTYGRISRYGLFAFASSLDTVGILTNTVEDAALLLHALSGVDMRDATSVRCNVPDFTSKLNNGVKGLKIAVLGDINNIKVNADVYSALERASKKFESLGAFVVRIPHPFSENALYAYYIISSAEASSNLARYDGVRFTERYADAMDGNELFTKTRDKYFGDEVKRRIMLGTFTLSQGAYENYYGNAVAEKERVKRKYAELFEEYDIILSPVSASSAPLSNRDEIPTDEYKTDIFTVTEALAGIPAISVPFGHSKEGLPIGIQLSAREFDEETLLRAAYCLREEYENDRSI